MIEKTTRTGLVTTLAERSAKHPRIQTAVIAAVQSVLPGVIEELLWEMAPQGEQLRIYKPKIGKAHKAARDERIRALLRDGQATSSIAAREGVSARHVFRIKAQLVAAVEVE